MLNKIKSFIKIEPNLSEDEYKAQLATLAAELGIWKSDFE